MSGSGLSGFIGLCDEDKWIKAISLSAYLESMRRAKLLHGHILKTAEYKTQLSRLAKVQGLLFEDINEKDANKLIIYIFNILYESSPERFTASYHNQITKLTNKDKEEIYQFSVISIQQRLEEQNTRFPCFAKVKDDIIAEIADLFALPEHIAWNFIREIYETRQPNNSYDEFGLAWEMAVHAKLNPA